MKGVKKMKITDERYAKKLIRYGELFPGDVFEACGSPCMKIDDENAIELDTAKFICRQAHDFVCPLDAELVIS